MTQVTGKERSDMELGKHRRSILKNKIKQDKNANKNSNSVNEIKQKIFSQCFSLSS